MRSSIACLALCLLCTMQPGAARDAAYGSIQPKIGRASCRERV